MCRWPVGYWDGVDQDDSGVASAMVNTMQQVGGALGLAIFTSISTSAVGRYVSSHAGQRRDRLQTLAALSSYHTVFWVAAGVFVAGAVLTAAIFRPRPCPSVCDLGPGRGRLRGRRRGAPRLCCAQGGWLQHVADIVGGPTGSSRHSRGQCPCLPKGRLRDGRSCSGDSCDLSAVPRCLSAVTAPGWARVVERSLKGLCGVGLAVTRRRCSDRPRGLRAGSARSAPNRAGRGSASLRRGCRSP